jgi:SAM-dependent methyltransferase
MLDKTHYENPDLWTQERFDNPDQQGRFAVCADLFPAGVQSLLDVGCGNGAFMAFLEGRNTPIKLLGLERSQAAISAAVCRAEIREGSVDAIPFEDRTFDLITAMEVIEHLPYGLYQHSLREMERVAANHILITVPYREKRRQARCPYCGCRFDRHYHMRTFDESVLEGIFHSFRPVQFVHISVDDYVFAPLLRAAYRLISRNRDFPRTATCPQCGFAGYNPDNQTLSTPVAHTRRWLRDSFKARLPKYKRVNWIAALYGRSSA